MSKRILQKEIHKTLERGGRGRGQAGESRGERLFTSAQAPSREEDFILIINI